MIDSYHHMSVLEMTSPLVWVTSGSQGGRREAKLRGVRAFNGFVVGGLLDGSVSPADTLVTDMIPLGNQTAGRKQDVLVGFIFHQNNDRRYFTTPVINGVERADLERELLSFSGISQSGEITKDRYETRIFLSVNDGVVSSGELNSFTATLELYHRYYTDETLTSRLVFSFDVPTFSAYIPTTSEYGSAMTSLAWEDKVDYGPDVGEIIAKPSPTAPEPYYYKRVQQDITAPNEGWIAKDEQALLATGGYGNPWMDSSVMQDILSPMGLGSSGGTRYANMLSEFVYNSRANGVWRRIAALYNFASPSADAAFVDIKNPNRTDTPTWYIPAVLGDPYPPGVNFHPWVGYSMANAFDSNALDLGFKLSGLFPYSSSDGGIIVLYDGDDFSGTLVGCSDENSVTKIGAIDSSGSRQMVYASQAASVSNTDLFTAKAGASVMVRYNSGLTNFYAADMTMPYTSFSASRPLPDANVFVGATNYEVDGVQTVSDFLDRKATVKSVCFFGGIDMDELNTLVRLLTRLAGNKRRTAV